MTCAGRNSVVFASIEPMSVAKTCRYSVVLRYYLKECAHLVVRIGTPYRVCAL